jgi:uncharacterized protein (TIGR00255 family)
MKSMTGFAQARFESRDFSLFISFKSYNNRYLEVGFKGCGITAVSEKIIRELLKDRLQRGKIEIVLDLFQNNQKNWDIRLNSDLLEAIISRVRPLQEKHGQNLTLSLDGLLKLPMVFHLDYNLEHLAARDLAFIRRSLAKVFADFLNSRSQEGALIGRDLQASLALIEGQVKIIAGREKESEKDAFRNYRKRIAKFVDGLHVDERRIAQEAAISAEKTSIAEEVNRLRTHCRRLKALLADKTRDAIGREADFLAQEMQRETHTIAAKTNCLDIHRHILVVRREIEKIRQQVQNIE